MKKLLILVALLSTACSNASDLVGTKKGKQRCEIRFTTQMPCDINGVSVKLDMTTIEEDEKSLQALEVVYKGNNQTLKITADTSLIKGDKGYISLADINFDGIPDIAITTSFGVANLYLDYWVFNVEKDQYVSIGNYSELKLDKENRTLNNVVKLNAANYEKKSYTWDGYRLV